MKSFRIIMCLIFGLSAHLQTTKSQITDEASFNQIFNIIFSHNFENDTEGAYKETEWKRDWNYPSWANHALGYGKIMTENSSKNLQISFPKGEMGMDSSGVQWHGKFSQGYDELYLTYKIKFSAGFSNKDLQGKLPGFSGAASNTGGNLPTGTDGWSTRYMFHGTEILFYLYYPEMYKDYGDATPVAGKTYYGSAVYFVPGFTLQPNVWYNVTQRVVMNTIGKADGLVEGYLNGKLCAVKTGMRFRDISSIQIDRINFGNFLGGSGKPPINDELISYDDFCVFSYKSWVNVPRGTTKSASGRSLFMPDINQLKTWGASLNVQNVTSGSADVQWTSYPLNISGYIIERKADSETAFTTVATLPYGQNLYKDLNLTAGRNYTYRIKAYNNSDFTDYSQEKSIQTTAAANNSPIIKDQFFTIQQSSFTNNLIGKVIASDPDGGQLLSYEILSGNTSGFFSLNSSTGEIKTTTSNVFRAGDTLTYILNIKITDNATTPKSTSANVTIRFIGNPPVNNAPVIQNQLFSIKQALFTSTFVGKIAASDADADQKLSYAITSGNSGIFVLNSTTGELTTTSLNVFKAGDTITHILNITVTDNAISPKSNSAAVTVKFIGNPPVVAVNNSPVISNQSFSINQSSFTANYIGKITATDVDAGQKLTFSIETGNSTGIFAINSATGDLTTTTSDVFKPGETLTYTLTIKVTDNGTTPKSVSAAVVVRFTGNPLVVINNPPVINNQILTVKEPEFANNYIGKVIATDADLTQKIAFAITSGNASGLFEINSETGILYAKNSTIFKPGTHEYTLTVAVTDNAPAPQSSSATVTVILEGNSKKETKAVSLQVYPNPSKGSINVAIETPEEPSITGIEDNTLIIEILDLAGNSLTSRNTESTSNIENFDLSEFRNGTYIVSVKKSNMVVSKRLIINK